MTITSCHRCIYWKPLSDDTTKKEGNCLRHTPVMLGSSRGRWPVTLATEGCAEGSTGEEKVCGFQYQEDPDGQE